MLLQTNSYVVPHDKRAEHARLLRRFRQVLNRIGCDQFEVYEQVGANWNTAEVSGRVVQIMRFRDRRHQLAVQAAERNDPVAQAVIAEFCNLINFPYQQQQGLFAVGFYNAVLPSAAARAQEAQDTQAAAAAAVAAAAGVAGADAFHAPVETPVAPAAPFGAAEPTADTTEEQTPEAAVELDAAAGDLARDEAQAAEADNDTPALHAEDPLFAEGTEGIIAAAEQLTDEALDAGGDAAVADAIAAASSNGAADPSADPLQAENETESSHPLPARQVELHAGSQPPEEAGIEDLDLAALLDPHLDSDNGQPAPQSNGAAHGKWEDSLSLEGMLDDDDRGGADRGPSSNEGALDRALEPESERDRNHVTP